MIHDLRTILDGWEYEPGKISVRKIIGRDGREKIQTRVDLGVLQFELTGRPDGQRPHGFESMLDSCEQALSAHQRQQTSEEFELTPEQCRELRHEAHLYYQRFLSLFVLEDFDAVDRDTQRNLRVFDLCRDYGASEFDRAALEPQRAYLLMMSTRAKAYAAMRRRDHAAALNGVLQGMRHIEELAGGEDAPGDPPELGVLASLREEVLKAMPSDAPPRLEWELQLALANEDYERAARLRDRLASVSAGAHRG